MAEMKAINVSASSQTRVAALLAAFRLVDENSKISMYTGLMQPEGPSVVVDIDSGRFGITVSEARTVAKILEFGQHVFGFDADFTNLMEGLRLVADRAEQDWGGHAHPH